MQSRFDPRGLCDVKRSRPVSSLRSFYCYDPLQQQLLVLSALLICENIFSSERYEQLSVLRSSSDSRSLAPQFQALIRAITLPTACMLCSKSELEVFHICCCQMFLDGSRSLHNSFLVVLTSVDNV